MIQSKWSDSEMSKDVENESLVEPINTVAWIDGWDACGQGCIHHDENSGDCLLNVGKDELEIKSWGGLYVVVCTKFED
jgi:hypothetical protein